MNIDTASAWVSFMRYIATVQDKAAWYKYSLGFIRNYLSGAVFLAPDFQRCRFINNIHYIHMQRNAIAEDKVNLATDKQVVTINRHILRYSPPGFCLTLLTANSFVAAGEDAAVCRLGIAVRIHIVDIFVNRVICPYLRRQLRHKGQQHHCHYQCCYNVYDPTCFHF